MKLTNKLFLASLFSLSVAAPALAATLSVQNLSVAGLSVVMGSASTGDKFTNDGSTYLMFTNASAAVRTLTLTVQNATVNQAGFNPLTISNPTVSLSSSGVNGGVTVVGPFGTTEFNDSNGMVNYTVDAVAALTVAAIKLPRQN